MNDNNLAQNNNSNNNEGRGSKEGYKLRDTRGRLKRRRNTESSDGGGTERGGINTLALGSLPTDEISKIPFKNGQLF